MAFTQVTKNTSLAHTWSMSVLQPSHMEAWYRPSMTSIGGTNSIVIEHFQQEDWHVATLKVGDIYRFPGAICGHFTMENTTPTTRVSLDFRVIAGTLFNDSDHYSSSPGYYAKAEKEKEGVGKWVCTGPLPLPDPDARNGFPFTNK